MEFKNKSTGELRTIYANERNVRTITESMPEYDRIGLLFFESANKNVLGIIRLERE